MLSQKTRTFLLAHPWLVTYPASAEHPFTIAQLLRYREILPWHSVSINQNIAWNTEILDTFIEELFPMHEEKDMAEHPTSFIESNPAISWTTELFERFEHCINWELVVMDGMLSPEQRKQFNNRICMFEEDDESDYLELSTAVHLEYEQSLLNKHPELGIQQLDAIEEDKVDWKILSLNEFIPWNDAFIDQYENRWNWENLSRNKSLCWSDGLLERYIDRWDWSNISLNRGLPWSADLIRKYEKNIHWDVLKVDENGYISKPVSTVGWNMDIPWTNEMLIEYSHKLYLDVVAMNTQIPWDFKRFEILCKYGNSTKLVFYNELLRDIFPEIFEEEHLIPLLEEILKNFRNGDYGKLPVVDSFEP